MGQKQFTGYVLKFLMVLSFILLQFYLARIVREFICLAVLTSLFSTNQTYLSKISFLSSICVGRELESVFTKQ